MTEYKMNKTNILNHQVAIVTGGGRGLGRAFARALASAGARVVVVSRSEDELKTTVQLIEEVGGTSIYFPADVTDGPSISAIVAKVPQRFGAIEILVNNAAVLTPLGY